MLVRTNCLAYSLPSVGYILRVLFSLLPSGVAATASPFPVLRVFIQLFREQRFVWDGNIIAMTSYHCDTSL